MEVETWKLSKPRDELVQMQIKAGSSQCEVEVARVIARIIIFINDGSKCHSKIYLKQTKLLPKIL
jgi:hypothetical protein